MLPVSGWLNPARRRTNDVLPAPDFPTAGIIHGISGVRDGYRTGRGRVVMRGRTHTEELDRGKREAIIVDELPYQVNKKNFIEKIAELVNGKKIDGISDLRDESDKSGMRVVIELKRGEIPDVVLNNLYKQTQLQDSFGMNMVALIDGQPKLLNLKEILDAFLRHRREVITRRTVYDLKKARDRGHVLEGLAVALENVDEMIKIIKSAKTPPEAKIELMKQTWKSTVVEGMLQKTTIGLSKPDGLSDKFGLTEKGYKLSDNQAQEILQLRLQRLTGLEQEKIVSEYKNILDKSGGVCILPTETVYGIASLADDRKAIDRIYAIKGRDFNKSLAVCVKDLGQAEKYGVFNKNAISTEKYKKALIPIDSDHLISKKNVGSTPIM